MNGDTLRFSDIRKLLAAIRESKGPYTKDPLQHAHNCIDRAERLANAGMEAIDANSHTIITEALDNDD